MDAKTAVVPFLIQVTGTSLPAVEGKFAVAYGRNNDYLVVAFVSGSEVVRGQERYKYRIGSLVLCRHARVYQKPYPQATMAEVFRQALLLPSVSGALRAPAMRSLPAMPPLVRMDATGALPLSSVDPISEQMPLHTRETGTEDIMNDIRLICTSANAISGVVLDCEFTAAEPTFQLNGESLDATEAFSLLTKAGSLIHKANEKLKSMAGQVVGAVKKEAATIASREVADAVKAISATDLRGISRAQLMRQAKDYATQRATTTGKEELGKGMLGALNVGLKALGGVTSTKSDGHDASSVIPLVAGAGAAAAAAAPIMIPALVSSAPQLLSSGGRMLKSAGKSVRSALRKLVGYKRKKKHSAGTAAAEPQTQLSDEQLRALAAMVTPTKVMPVLIDPSEAIATTGSAGLCDIGDNTPMLDARDAFL